MTSPFRLGDARWALARIPLLPDEEPEPGAPVEPVVAEGMLLSSEVDADSSPEHTQRRQTTARAYQIRARRRTTPQGVFAAVADLEISDTGTALTVGGMRTRSYPSPVWLHALCDRAMDHAGVVRGLTFTTHNLAVRRGDRLEVERPSGNPQTGPQRRSVGATDAVHFVMDVCRCGASWQQVADALAHTRPNVPGDAVDSVLRALVHNGFLLTDLTPTDSCNDPLGHVLARLPHTSRLYGELSRLRAALAEADEHPPGHAVRRGALATARTLTDELVRIWRPLCADTVSDSRIRFPTVLAEHAARAAGVLWRLAPGHDPLADWHQRFLHRYGTQRAVPLLAACDPVTGLGYDTDQPPSPEASEVLAGLLTDALISGRMEVHLDDDTIDALDQRAADDRPEPSVDVYAQVIAPSTRDRDEGNLVLAITDATAPAGSTRARFTGLLPAAGADTGHGTLTAELVCQPLTHAAAALTGPAEQVPWRIPIGTIPRPGDMLLNDLSLVSDGHRLSLWSTQHQRPVRPVHRNRLGHHLMPPVAGFLCLVGQHGTVALNPWTWAPFDRAPFLPRVRYQDTILTPARWRLPDVLRHAARERSSWIGALRDWRNAARPAPPASVVVDDTDRQLPLDLERHDDAELLRRYVARGVATLTEPPGGPDAVQAVARGPSGYHRLEIVIPLAAHPHPEPTISPSLPACTREPGEGRFHPGGPWLSLAIAAPPSTQDAVVERLAAAARDAAATWDRWFWLRYATAERGPHLRIRFHGEPATLGGQLLPRLGHACARLIAEGLSGGFTVEHYDQEIERYGGLDTVEAVEAIFYRDSELAAAMLADTRDSDERIALTAVSAAEITRIVADGDRGALVPHRLERADRHVHARVRPHCRDLDNAGPPHPALREARASTLTAYRELLPPSRRVDCASSLIHMHANRMLGNTDNERIARALAADLLARRRPS